jgi:hypothetical protein
LVIFKSSANTSGGIFLGYHVCSFFIARSIATLLAIIFSTALDIFQFRL